MLSILIVEDEIQKRSVICDAIGTCGRNLLFGIESVSDAHEARRALKRKKFDLLILDINIPSRIDDVVREGAGLDVIRFIRDNDAAIAPTITLCLTAYDDAVAAAERELGFQFWKLVKFSYEERSWRQTVLDALQYLGKTTKPPFYNDGNTYHNDLCIVVALEEELQAILSLPGDWAQVEICHDANRYWKGQFTGSEGRLSVVVALGQIMGMPSAAVISSQLIHTFRPKYLAMAGICAGVRDKAAIGDILVADPCFDWGSGKWRERDDGEGLEFRPAAYQWRLDTTLRTDMRNLANEEGLLHRIWLSFIGTRPEQAPEVLIEAMASGGSVLQAKMLMEEVQEHHKNLIGVDMELYAVFTAATYAAAPRPKCFAVKAVSDFGDGEKNDHYHKYAAHCSAQFLYQFALAKLPSVLD